MTTCHEGLCTDHNIDDNNECMTVTMNDDGQSITVRSLHGIYAK